MKLPNYFELEKTQIGKDLHLGIDMDDSKHPKVYLPDIATMRVIRILAGYIVGLEREIEQLKSETIYDKLSE